MKTWKIILIAALVIVALYFTAAFMFDIWPFGGGLGEDETEQVDPTPTPAPIVQIEIDSSDVKGEHAWSNIPADKQKLLTETDAPDFNGEKILLAYKVTGSPSGGTKYWIQTEATDGSVRNIFTDKSHVIIWY